ncbi:MAG TPA: superoxide dismutase family protein [Oligoflexus sp.]|uniref:superoxide dismutase family protein n=1 Tax=Oligoflexus sp. TaxID=1971216 RepID=UPI002D7E8CD8|nr:superoxide dismutase family protein [Oligoflexus sp.]HET9236571.1 superoxide dismutase family protein [Oligoflexus sp.]
MKKEFCVLALTLVTAPAWAQTQNTRDLKQNAEQRTEAKMASDLKQGVTFAEATLAPKSGSKLSGTVIFSRVQNAVQVIASITGGTPGKHGIHIHEKGDCSAADASSAGGHFNPTGAPHAGPTAQARHVGDLGNITVKGDGVGYLTLDVPNVNGFTDWNSIIGKAVVVHAKVDDEKSQPAGAAGDRIACGVIQGVTAQGPSQTDAKKQPQK